MTTIRLRRRARSRCAGFTVIEMMIAVPVLVIIVGVAGLAAKRGTDAFAQSTAIDALDRRTGRAMRALAEELHGSRSGGFLPDPTDDFGSDVLTFQRQVGYTAGVPVFGDLIRLERVDDPTDPANGIDDDGDGLVDEGLVQIVTDAGGPNESTRVVSRNVAPMLAGELPNGIDDNGNGLIDEPGLVFRRDGGYLTIRITTQAPFRNTALTRTLESSIGLRN